MKAKEYADRYKANPTEKELLKVAFDLLMEVKSLAEQRKIKSNAGLFGILNEIEDKWKAFVRLVGDPYLRTDGFRGLVKEKFPLAYLEWIDYQKECRR